MNDACEAAAAVELEAQPLQMLDNHLSAFHAVRGPTNNPRMAYPFLESARRSLQPPTEPQTTELAANAASGDISSSSSTSTRPINLDDYLAQSNRCTSSPAMVPIDLEKMEKKIEQYSKEWAELKRTERKSRCQAATVRTEIKNERRSEGRKKRSRSKSSNSVSNVQEETLSSSSSSREGQKTSRNEKKGSKTLLSFKWLSKGKEVDDISLRRKKPNKADSDGGMNRAQHHDDPTPAFSAQGKESNLTATEGGASQRSQRKVTIGAWEKASTVTQGNGRPRQHVPSCRVCANTSGLALMQFITFRSDW